MKYRLQIRRINESDLGAECPFMPEEDDFEIYLHALIEDVKSIEVVVSVSLDSDCLEIEIKSEDDFNTLRQKTKEILINQFNNELTTVNGFVKGELA